MKWFGRGAKQPETHIDPETKVILDDAEGKLAGRLSKLTGKRRDDVLAEAYRRADKILNGKHRS